MKAKKIELKTTEFTNDAGVTGKVLYRDLLNIVITSSGQQGMSTDDVIKAVEIKTQLKASADVLHLSEQDYGWVLSRMNNTVRWNLASEQLAEFIKDVREAPLVDMEEPAK